MKKFFSCLVLCVCLLLSGVVLFACDTGGDRTISFDINEAFFDVKVISNREEVERAEDGSATVANESNVRLELYAKQYSIDISSMVIKENDKERTLQDKNKYNPFEQDGQLYCGYFLIPHIDKNTTISISGEKIYQSIFSFESTNLEDETICEKLKSAEIAFDDNFVNLYDVVTNKTSFVRDYDVTSGTENGHHVFKLRFNQSNLYDMIESAPFRVRYVDGRESFFGGYTPFMEYTYVDLGAIEYQTAYTIVVDFNQLEYCSYSFALPEDTSAYSVSTSTDTIDFANEGFLYINKKSSDVDFSGVGVRLDSVVLEKVEENEETITFKIPSHITPTFGFAFHVVVSGIEES